MFLVSYQAEGTLGRILQKVAQSVRVQGEEFPVRARIRSIELYSGHADGPELADWIRQRLPIAHELFLVHGEAPAIAGLAARLEGIVASTHVLLPVLDQTFELTPFGARWLTGPTAPRLAPERVGRLDWHNEVSRLILDINDGLAAMRTKGRATS